jgi:adenosylmethionine-8-amino-7-oxononanoate aminotransferase
MASAFDALGGIFVATLGHRHPRVMEAMRRQMDTMTFAPPLHGISDVTLDFIEKVGSITPPGLTYVKPFSGGSEAVEAAFKFVRQYFKQTGHPGKYKFISRYQSYHGGTFGGMSASGTGPRKSKFEPQMGGFLKVLPPNAYRDRFSSWEEANRCAAEWNHALSMAQECGAGKREGRQHGGIAARAGILSNSA